MRGILLVDKLQGWTSFDVVNYCKKLLSTREVGHLGTLDPMATGVLAVTIGSATKLFDMFLNKTKTYIAKFQFGYVTDTLDADGVVEKILNGYELTKDIKIDENVTYIEGNIPTLDDIKSVLNNFIGEIQQLPPKYSAKKIQGRKAYDLARSGVEFELKPSKVTINNLEVIDYIDNILTIKIDCGAGTYIRSLCRDIAQSLNSIATMISLRRTKVGSFELSECIDIKQQNAETIIEHIKSIDSVFNNISTLDDEMLVNRLLNGQTVVCDIKDGEYKLYLNGEFKAIALAKDRHIKMSKYFK